MRAANSSGYCSNEETLALRFGGQPAHGGCFRQAGTRRTARAHAFVRIAPAVLRQLPRNPKGNPLEIARIAGIAAAKRTSELIPLCHPLMLTHADVEVTLENRACASSPAPPPPGRPAWKWRR
jgi:hypothetical protein